MAMLCKLYGYTPSERRTTGVASVKFPSFADSAAVFKLFSDGGG